MSRTLTQLFSLYQLTPGRRIYALERVRGLAGENELAEIVEAIDVAVAHDRHTLDLDAARLDPTKPPPVRKDDVVVDRRLKMIDRLLSDYAEDEDGDDDDQAVALALRATCFPSGVMHHVKLPFVEQAVANERVLDILEAPDNQAWLDEHGLRPFIERLRKAHDQFAASMKLRDSDSLPTWDEVKAAREQGQELYLSVVVMILSRCLDEPELRTSLMAPIMAQNEKIRLYRRNRRRPSEVDPDTGEPLEGEAEAGETGEDDEPLAEAE